MFNAFFQCEQLICCYFNERYTQYFIQVYLWKNISKKGMNSGYSDMSIHVYSLVLKNM